MSRTKHHGGKAKARNGIESFHWALWTPGWWRKMLDIRPQRRAVKLWEREATKTDDIESLDTPPHGNKPHSHYY